MRKLTKEQRRDIRVIGAKKDADIDFSDIPLVPDWSKAEIGKFYRPKKQPVTMRLDSDVIDWLKSGGSGYQTKANWLLRNAMIQMQELHRIQILFWVRKNSARRAKKKKVEKWRVPEACAGPHGARGGCHHRF